MISFSQETDSQNQSGTHSKSCLSFGTGDATTGVNEQAVCFPRSGTRNPVQHAVNVFSDVKDPSVVEQARKILATIQGMILRVQQRRSDLTDIPPVCAHSSEDGSVLLEWIFSDFRIGFNIEPNPDDSGWHLVSNKKLGEIAVSKPLPRDLARMSETIAMLIEFIVASI